MSKSSLRLQRFQLFLATLATSAIAATTTHPQIAQAQIRQNFCPPEYPEYSLEAASELITVNICIKWGEPNSGYDYKLAMASWGQGFTTAEIQPAITNDDWSMFLSTNTEFPIIVTEQSTTFVEQNALFSHPNTYFYKILD